MKKAIGLRLPERHKPGKDSFDIRPRAVDKWIEALPRASVGRCAQLIYSVLKETNHLQVKHKERVYLLEALREPVQYVSQAMQKHYVSSSLPLPDKSLKIAYATREIYLLMATGYKIAIEDTLSGSLFLDRKQLTRLVHRAMTYLSRMLLTTYQIYEPVPENTWLNLYKLYAHAEMLGLHKVAVADNQHQYISKTNIHGEFVRILLLSLASPYHMRHGEVGNVYVNLERWMNLAHLSHAREGQLPAGNFVLELDSDRQPCYIALVDEEKIADGSLILDTFPLTEAILAKLQKSEEIHSRTLVRVNMEKASLSHDLLRCLSTSWGVKPDRAHERKTCNAEIKIAIGLSATHQAILDYAHRHTDFEQQIAQEDSQIMRVIEKQSHYPAHDVARATDNQPDVWEMVFDNGRLELVNARVVGSALDNMPTTHYCTMDGWKLLNQSTSGFCVQCTRDCGHCLQVGEIIGMTPSDASSPEHWTVGVIRWMKTEGKNITAGGQLLGRAAIPAGITVAAKGTKKERVQRALLMPAVKQLDRPSTLVTHAGVFREGAIVHVYLPAGTIEMKLKRDFEAAGLYSEYEYQQISTVSMDNKSKPQDNDEFDDVWSSI